MATIEGIRIGNHRVLKNVIPGKPGVSIEPTFDSRHCGDWKKTVWEKAPCAIHPDSLRIA